MELQVAYRVVTLYYQGEGQSIKEQIHYNEFGQKHGAHLQFNEFGQLDIVNFYEHGVLISSF